MNDLVKLGVQLPLGKPSAILGRGSPNGKTAPLPGNDVKEASPGKCDPKPVCISNPLTLNLTPTQLAFPPCINIHRCDGCCPTNEVCVPIKSHEVILTKVGIINFEGEGVPKYNESYAPVLNHTECQCQCQWDTSEDCKKLNPNFVKSDQFCECVCPEELQCSAFHEFDREMCICRCKRDKFERLEEQCRSKGFSWNTSVCRCDPGKTATQPKNARTNKKIN